MQHDIGNSFKTIRTQSCDAGPALAQQDGTNRYALE